jgi:UDP-glucose 4-epimerase
VLKLYDTIVGATGVDIAPVMAAPKRGEQLRSCLDPSAALAHLGWEPWTPLEDGLAMTVEAFRGKR